jgi:hypothetical protein
MQIRRFGYSMALAFAEPFLRSGLAQSKPNSCQFGALKLPQNYGKALVGQFSGVYILSSSKTPHAYQSCPSGTACTLANANGRYAADYLGEEL